MAEPVDITPATIAQVQRLRDGRLLVVDDDVAGVARDLRAIDRGLRVYFSPEEGVFVVYHEQDGVERLVTTSTTCDQRLVRRVHEISAPGYELASEIERLEDERNRELDRQHSEWVGEIGERLAHALRTDLGERRHF